jgi:hypothetical protein
MDFQRYLLKPNALVIDPPPGRPSGAAAFIPNYQLTCSVLKASYSIPFNRNSSDQFEDLTGQALLPSVARSRTHLPSGHLPTRKLLPETRCCRRNKYAL